MTQATTDYRRYLDPRVLARVASLDLRARHRISVVAVHDVLVTARLGRVALRRSRLPENPTRRRCDASNRSCKRSTASRRRVGLTSFPRPLP